MSPWALAPLRRVRGHEARAAARALGEALRLEAEAALEVARRLEAAEVAARALAGPAGAPTVEAASLAGAAACAWRHAEALQEARAAALRAAGEAEGRRAGLVEARAAARALEALEARWASAQRRDRLRREEAALDDLPRAAPRPCQRGTGEAHRDSEALGDARWSRAVPGGARRR